MDTLSYLLTSGLIGYALYLVAWIVAIIISVIMLRHGGGSAERFLLTGCCLMLIGTLFGLSPGSIHLWMVGKGYGLPALRAVAPVIAGFNFAGVCISFAGVVCLIKCLWTKFRVSHDP